MLLPELFQDEVFRIETPRLWLRWPRATDAPALQRIAAREEVAAMTATWPHPLPENEAAWRILRMRESNAAGTGLNFAIVRKKRPDELIGTVGVSVPAVSPVAAPALRLGYLLDPQWQGKGMATEAVEVLTGAVLVWTRFTVITASSRLDNPASRRVLEKAGFVATGRSWLNSEARGGAIEVEDFELTRAKLATHERHDAFRPAAARAA